MSDEREVNDLAQLLWRWHDESGAPLEVRSYLRGLAAWLVAKGVRVAAPTPAVTPEMMQAAREALRDAVQRIGVGTLEQDHEVAFQVVRAALAAPKAELP